MAAAFVRVTGSFDDAAVVVRAAAAVSEACAGASMGVDLPERPAPPGRFSLVVRAPAGWAELVAAVVRGSGAADVRSSRWVEYDALPALTPEGRDPGDPRSQFPAAGAGGP